MMKVPAHIQALIDQEVTAVRRTRSHALLPYRRLMLYDAFGPTFASSTYKERIRILQHDQLPLTQADRVRASLALLTAQRVFPFWRSSLQDAGLLTLARIGEDLRYVLSELIRLHVRPEIQPTLTALLTDTTADYARLLSQIAALDSHHVDPKQQAIMQECLMAGLQAVNTTVEVVEQLPLDPQLVEHRSVYLMPVTELPMHILQLAEGTLHGTVAPSNALSQSGDIENSLGNFFGYTEEEFPARAYDVCQAAYEALNQALGLGPFDRQEITPTTTDASLMGEGAAAAAALKAYSGVFEGNISTSRYDPNKQLEFWLWWLTEAILQAWAAEPDAADPPDLATMPFTATVRVTKYRTNVKFTFNGPLDDAE